MKARDLACHAISYTENEAMRAESCYQLARIFHVQVCAIDFFFQIEFKCFNYYIFCTG